MTEYAARIGAIVADTLLIGHTVFGRLEQILRRSDKTNDREQAKGNGEISAVFIISAQHLAKIGTYTVGNIAGAAATAAAILNVLHNPNAKHDRINHLDHSLRHVSLTADGNGASTEIVRAFARLKNADVAFATVQYDVLFKNGNPLELLRPCVNARLKSQLDIKANGDGIKSTVKLYGLDRNIRPANLSTFHANIRRVLNDLLPVIGQIYAYVLKAITIPAGIQNSVGFDTNGFLGVTGIACKSVIRHSNTSVV